MFSGLNISERKPSTSDEGPTDVRLYPNKSRNKEMTRYFRCSLQLLFLQYKPKEGAFTFMRTFFDLSFVKSLHFEHLNV
jgi:hypothetical protein